MITREEDIDAHALHRQGWTISAIAVGELNHAGLPALGCLLAPWLFTVRTETMNNGSQPRLSPTRCVCA